MLRALVQGSNVARIAEANVVSEATVRSQVRAILVKLDVGSQLEAVARAHRCGWRLRHSLRPQRQDVIRPGRHGDQDV